MNQSGSMIEFQFDGFVWDDEKALSNWRKHKIDFRDAIKIFKGAVFAWSQDHQTEDRWIAIGNQENSEVTVVFVERGAFCRVISARPATRKERAWYYQNLIR